EMQQPNEKPDGPEPPLAHAACCPKNPDDGQFFGRYAEGLRPPTMRETMVSDANATPNFLLDAERTKSWEIGANVLRNGVFTEKDKLRLKFSYFNNNHHNYISRVNAPPV